MRVWNVAFLFISTTLVWGAWPFSIRAAPSIISQNSGVSQPYSTAYGYNVAFNDPRYLVATGTVSSFAAPVVSVIGLSGDEVLYLKLYNYYFSRGMDCQTPAKTADEWGITRIARDPNAPVAVFGPFSGTECNIDKDFGGPHGPGGRTILIYHDYTYLNTNLAIMGNDGYVSYTVYGADTPSITLLGAATTTAEFGGTFTDLGATAHDSTDGDITNKIQVTGSVNTGIMGTTTLTYVVTNSHGLSTMTTRTVVVACVHDCVSNVLFLPGIKGSHLYRPKDDCDADLLTCEDRLWEPGLDEGVFSSLMRGAGNDDMRDLFLDASGASVRSDIYVKERDVLDSAGGKDFYASFVSDMDALQADGTISDWEPVAYDWRLSLSDIVEKGKKTGDRISYLEATSTPYIEQELRRLAASSKTGKVTIVAHSNGGLVVKTLLAKLGESEAASLVDDIIFVGVPQSGAPRAVGALLYGTGEGLPSEHFDFLVSKAVAREFSEHSPMAYHLLPSMQYFADVHDSSHAVSTFVGTAGFEKERAAYGSTLDTAGELHDFLLAREGGREKPAASDVSAANVLDEALLGYARDTHEAVDAWLPPSGITLYQIAGWGVDTVAGLRFTELPAAMAGPFAALHRKMFSPTFVEDGDGVVPVPSALMTSTTTPNVKRYWINLREYNKHHTNVKHGNLFEIQELRDFISGIFNGADSLPEFIELTQPSSQTADKKLVFILHSPLSLQLQDSSGNTTGLSRDDSVTQDIPGATYGEFGEVQYIIAPEGDYTLLMSGQAEGTFSLEMQEMSGNTVVSSAIIANVPTTESTLASLTISGGLDTASPLSVDEDGDGSSDITIAPEAGEIINYEPPASVPEPVVSSSGGGGGGGGSISTAIPVTPEVEVATTSTPVVVTATTTQPVATTTPEATASTTTVQSKKPSVPVIASVQKSQKVATPPRKTNAIVIPQTASVYEASQQPLVTRMSRAVYNGLHGFWLALKKLF